MEYGKNNIGADDSNSTKNENSGNESKLDGGINIYQKQLRRLASELSLTEARERREIASDLHDHIGQALAYVSQKVSMLQGNSIFSGMEKDFSEIIAILNQTIRYTRNLTVEISPPVLYDFGLPAAIEWLAERTIKQHKLKVISSESGILLDIAEDIKVFIFKAIQELINNVVKHADANQILIHANWRESEFEITVIDDGRGFDSQAFESVLSASCCFGLFSIRERLSYIGGSLIIDSIPEKGTKVSLVAPYKIIDEATSD